MKEEGYEGVVCILSSSNISQDYNAACEARDLIRPFPVVVIDSHTSTMSQGFMVLEAVKCAEDALPLTEIVERVWSLRSKIHFYCLAGVLHYLVRSKRLGKVSAYLRALLNIKPIITINNEDGTIQSIAKVKSRREGFNYFFKKIEGELSRNGGKLHVAVVHAAEKEEAEKLLQEISQKFKCAEIFLGELPPALGCYTGPGVVGVNFFVE
jgi:DegV family protein with EDD domain